MHVLFLTHSYPRHSGDAAGSFLLRLAVALRGEGVEVSVVAPAAPGLASEETLEGITVERFRYAPRRHETLAYTGTMAEQVSASWSARVAMVGFLGAEFQAAVRQRRERKPAIVHAHWWFPNGLAGAWLAQMAGCPLVTTLHGTDVRLARNMAMMRPAFRHVLRHSTAVTAVSRWLAEEACRVVSVPPPVVAPMPVATDRFVPGDGAPRTPGALLFVGRLNRQKGLDVLLRALPLVEAPCTLDVVGDGEDGESLRTLAAEAGVADRVRWHGAMPHDRLAAFYQRAAALVVPSREEGLGMVAAEAQLTETPVIASRSGGLTDLIQEERTGLLVPEGDPAALAHAITSLLARGDRGAALGAAGRMTALATFAPESVARRYADIYRQALARPRASIAE